MPIYTHKLMRLDINNEWQCVRMLTELQSKRIATCASREKIVKR